MGLSTNVNEMEDQKSQNSSQDLSEQSMITAVDSNQDRSVGKLLLTNMAKTDLLNQQSDPSENEAFRRTTSIDIRSLKGIFLKGNNAGSTYSNAQITNLKKDKEYLIQVLRKTTNRIKAHYHNFRSRGAILYRIIADFFRQYESNLRNIKATGKEINDSLFDLRVNIEQKYHSKLSKMPQKAKNEFKDIEVAIMNICSLIQTSIKKCDSCIHKISIQSIYNPDKVRKISETIDLVYKRYSSLYSSILRDLSNDQPIEGYNSMGRSLTVLQYQLGILLRIFRTEIDIPEFAIVCEDTNKSGEEFYGLGEEIEALNIKLIQFQDTMRDDQDLNDQENKANKVNLTTLINGLKTLHFSDQINASYHKFIESVQNKLEGYSGSKEIEPKNQKINFIRDKKLKKFLEAYKINYESNSSLIINSIQRRNTPNDAMPESLLCLDVSLKIFLHRFLIFKRFLGTLLYLIPPSA